MKEREFQRSMAVLPIGVVMKLTNLSARQIRYYEEQRLFSPERNEGNRRMYSLNDVDLLWEISELISEGNNIAEVKQIFAKQKAKQLRALSLGEVHRALEREFTQQSRFAQPPTNFNQPRL